MIDVAENPRAVMGDNAPPATPFDAISAHIDDLLDAAKQFLDGDAITSQAVADEVGRLLDAARQAEKAADAQRKIDKKPHDDAAKAVQAQWAPIIARCSLIVSTAKQAVAPFLAAEQARKDAEAAEARRIADEATARAQEALRASGTDLAAKEEAEALLKDAKRADTTANRAGRDKAMVAGGGRAVSLRSVWTATLADPVAALKHYRETQPEALKAWLLEQAQRDVSTGARVIPGFTINESKVAQ
ncbi:MAG: hypothetical protein EON59_03805 [Alphaproteobacteria bacterium]|nr:MAG: hypothetical protein EON59_03805 [Alphaproteobacteria bacterium]